MGLSWGRPVVLVALPGYGGVPLVIVETLCSVVTASFLMKLRNAALVSGACAYDGWFPIDAGSITRWTGCSITITARTWRVDPPLHHHAITRAAFGGGSGCIDELGPSPVRSKEEEAAPPWPPPRRSRQARQAGGLRAQKGPQGRAQRGGAAVRRGGESGPAEWDKPNPSGHEERTGRSAPA